MTIAKGSCAKVYAGATTGPTTVCAHINDVKLSLSGKAIDVTEFAAACPTYAAKLSALKDLSATISGFLYYADPGQGFIFANHIADSTLWIKLGFGVAGASPTVNFQAIVEKIDIKDTVDGMQEVTFDVTNAGAAVTWT